jgi:glycosyltransferase involved in cell wall biosynthesis
MRIAWLSPYLPAPEDSGGRIRIANLARALAGEELHLYLRFSEDDPEQSTITELAPWRKIHGVLSRWPRFKSPLMPGVPLSFPPEVKRLLAEHDAQQAFDAVVLEHCYSAHALPRLQRAAVILSEHNVESDYYLYAMRSQPRQALGNLLEYARWRRFERRTWLQADAITVVNERDRVRVQRLRPDTGIVVPNGIALEQYTFVPPSRRRGHALLFLGLLSYRPNIEAARLLARRVLPLVRRRFPDATLTLAGRDPHIDVRRLASDAVRVTGTVPSTAELFDSHAVFVNPIAFGGGSSLKVLEPLATGLPLVASAFAVRGYGLIPETHYFQAESPAQIARAVCRIFELRNSLDELAGAARRFAERYAWREIGPLFADVVAKAVLARAAKSEPVLGTS